MSKKNHDSDIWQSATFEGATREALRRWRALSLEQIIMALEEMQELGQWLQDPSDKPTASASESPTGYDKIDRNKQD